MENRANQYSKLIQIVCQALLGHANREEVMLMLGTAAVESDFAHRVQIGGGPAAGLWQMEPATAVDIFDNYLRYNKKLYNRLRKTYAPDLPLFFKVPTRETLSEILQTRDYFACALARIKYLRVSAPIPDSVIGQANYWKTYYNTYLGKGSVKMYLDAWNQNRCQESINELYGSEVQCEKVV